MLFASIKVKGIVYGIGVNKFHQLGMKKTIHIRKFKKLKEFEKYLLDPNDIYTRSCGVTIKTFNHKIYSIGKNM